MPDIEDLRKRYRDADAELQRAEERFQHAIEAVGTIENQLTELGFNPSGDLDAQIAAKEKELSGILDTVESILADAETSLP